MYERCRERIVVQWSQRDEDFGERAWCHPHRPDTSLRTTDLVQLPRQNHPDELESRPPCCASGCLQAPAVAPLYQHGDNDDDDERHWRHPHPPPERRQTRPLDAVQQCQKEDVGGERRSCCANCGPDYRCQTREAGRLCEQGDVGGCHGRGPHRPERGQAGDAVELFQQDHVDAAISDAYGPTPTDQRCPRVLQAHCQHRREQNSERVRRKRCDA